MCGSMISPHSPQAQAIACAISVASARALEISAAAPSRWALVRRIALFASNPRICSASAWPSRPPTVEQQPLEVRADLDVHRGRGGRGNRAGRVVAVGERTVEDVVDVGGDDQPLDRQAHLRRDIAGEDVAEVAGRHREGDLALRRAKLERGGEVVHHLRHQARPVDRVDRADVEAAGHRGVAEHPLHHRLGVVEAAVDGHVVDVGRLDGGHLPALDVAHPAFRVEHEDVDVRRGPATASIAAEPVSPLVAPTIVRRPSRRERNSSNSRPSSCRATSLKASVGPWNSSSSHCRSSSCLSGVTAAWAKRP